MKIYRVFVSVLVMLLMFAFVGCGINSNEESDVTESGELSDEPVTEVSEEAEEADNNSGVFVMKLSINPELELTVDSYTGTVLSVECMNKDAEKLIKAAKLDLENLSYDEAAEKFITACADEGYLTADNSDISIEIVQGTAGDEVLNDYDARMETVYTNVDTYTDFDIEVHLGCPACGGSGICEQCHGGTMVTCDVCNGTGEASEDPEQTQNAVCDLCNGEGTRVCTECNGTAGSDCEECGGDGKIPCPDCNGTGGCTACNKTGVVTCDKCGGAGGDCEWCNGTGTMECKTCHGKPLCEGCEDEPGSGYHYCNACAGTGKKSCWRCNSTGYETCSRCNGTGVLEDDAEDIGCQHCNGSGNMPCPRCEGTGECSFCQGTGEITE